MINQYTPSFDAEPNKKPAKEKFQCWLVLLNYRVSESSFDESSSALFPELLDELSEIPK